MLHNIGYILLVQTLLLVSPCKFVVFGLRKARAQFPFLQDYSKTMHNLIYTKKFELRIRQNTKVSYNPIVLHYN